VGLSSILNSLSGFLGGVTGLSVGATTLWLCWPNINDCLVETSADVLPPPLKLNIIGGEAVALGVVPDGCPKEKTGLGSATGLGSTTGAGEVVAKEKGVGLVVSCSVRLAGAWSKENSLPSLISAKEGLGTSIAGERVLAEISVPSSPIKVALGSVLEGLCDPKVKGKGDEEDCGGTTCPKAVIVLAGFSSSIGASPSRLSGMEGGTFAPDEDSNAASSRQAGLLETENVKHCFGSTAVLDPNFGASGIASVGLFKEKGSTVVGVTSATDEEENNAGGDAEPNGVPVTVFSSGASIFCVNLSSEHLKSFSPSQKGFSVSLSGRVDAGSVGVGKAVKFNTGEGTGSVGVFARNWEEAKKLGILPLLLADVGRLSRVGVGLGFDTGTDKTTGAGSSDGVFPETKVGGFGILSVFAAPKRC
jgi:hypothetical protein